MNKKLVYILSSGVGRGIELYELRARDKVSNKRFTVICQYRLPCVVCRIDYNATLQCLSITLKLFEGRHVVGSGPIQCDNIKVAHKVSCRLELDREKERCRCIYALHDGAFWLWCAAVDFVGPEGKARRVGVTIQKVTILLANKSLSVVISIRRQLSCSVSYDHPSAAVFAEFGATTQV